MISHLSKLKSVKVDNSALPEIADAKKVKQARNGLPSDEVVSEAVEVFKGIANPIRLRLLHALTHDELCVGDLAHAFAVSMSVVSHQLSILRRLKLVAARDVGRQTYYRVVDEFVGELVHDCLAHAEKLHPSTPHHHALHALKRKR